jgi:hypothetical protein
VGINGPTSFIRKIHEALPLQGVSIFLPLAYASEALRGTNDPWWQFREAVSEFNNNRKEKIHFPRWVAIDESMSAWKPWTTKYGNLPNISFITKKPEPLGENPGLLLYS